MRKSDIILVIGFVLIVLIGLYASMLVFNIYSPLLGFIMSVVMLFGTYIGAEKIFQRIINNKKKKNSP